MARKKVWLGLLGFFLAFSVYGIKSPTQGELPDFRKIEPQIFAKLVKYFSPGELEQAFKKIGCDKIQTLMNYSGEEGRKYLLANTPKEYHPVLEKYKPQKPASEAELREVYPEISAGLLNALPQDKYLKFLDETTEIERGVEAHFMSWQGLGKFFRNLDFSKHQALLDHTPDWVLLDIGLIRYQTIKDYECIVYKQERVKGHLQGVEKILLKYREKPLSIYMKWLDGPFKGRETLYNEAIYKEKVRVREGGSGLSDRILGVVPAWLGLYTELAHRGSNHYVTEIGLKNLLDMIKKDYMKSKGTNDLKRKNHGIQEVDGHKVYVMESILPKDPNKGYYCYRMIHYIDYLRSLEIKAVMYNWDDQLYESYTYTQIKINPGLKDIDFDPNNPEYRL